MSHTKFRQPLPLILWVLFFCYATCAAIVFQKLLLPLIPSMHAGHGLLEGDAANFHAVAIQLAEQIKQFGWSRWSVYPAQGSTGNVAILAALYAIFSSYDPSLIVPVNAAIHALGGVLIFLLGRELWPGKVGRNARIMTATLFIVYPSALNWYGQIHKDGYAIAGVLLVLYSWIWGLSRPVSKRNATYIFFGSLAGIFLIGFVRPYNLLPLFAVMSVLFVVTVIILYWKKQGLLLAIYALVFTQFIAGAAFALKSDVDRNYTYAQWDGKYKSLASAIPDSIRANVSDSLREVPPDDWVWKKTVGLPKKIEHYVEAAARTRAGLIVSGIAVNAGSLIDQDVMPNSVSGVISYVPRALQVSIFAPFPDTWLKKISVTRLVAVAETLLWYLIAPGFLLALIFARRSAGLLLLLMFAAGFLALYGFTLANVGTLYRIRYPYLFLIMLVGVSGWVNFYTVWTSSRRQKKGVVLPEKAVELDVSTEEMPSMAKPRGKMLGAGLTVAFLTVLIYAGLFLRDVILARWFGIGDELDAFFVAILIPMFLVSVFSVPLGTMFIPAFLRANTISKERAQALISHIAFLFTGFLVILAILMGLFSHDLLLLVGRGFSPEKIQHALSILFWMLPILTLSGLVVLGNSILNALGKFMVPGIAQAVVPLCTILMLFIFGRTLGIVSTVIGMMLGQVINLIIVALSLRKAGISLVPQWRSGVSTRDELNQYLPLVAAALFVGLSAPVNSGMAANLAQGSVAALGLGNKLVLFITGIVGASVATIILPYFSNFMARNQLLDVRRELSFFLMAGTTITIPATILIYFVADYIVQIVFKGGAFQANDVRLVASVLSYGILQLPFFTSNILLLKFAIATRHAKRVMVASLLGLCVNVGLNLVLASHLGVAGIALATSLSVGFSASLLLLMFHRLGHITWVDVIMIALNWMLFSTMVICLHYRSYAGVVVTIFALTVLVIEQLTAMTRSPLLKHA